MEWNNDTERMKRMKRMERRMRNGAITLLAAVLLASAAAPLAAQKKDDKPTRSVKGIVTDELENLLPGAVVQLKNTKTLQVKSFILNKQGSYYFHGLDLNVDYELKALYKGSDSRTRTVSTFDNRKELVYNFKIKLKE